MDTTLKGKTILLVNTGSLKKKFIIQRLKKLGLTLVVLHKEENWAAPFVDHWIISDTSNHEGAILNVKKFLKNNPKIKIDGVLTFWEDDVLLTSKIVEQFNFIGIPYSIAKDVRNKYLFREFCSANNIPAPRHHIIQSKKDIIHVLKTYNFPLVVKPAFGASSAYVVKVNTKEEFLNTVDYIKKNLSTEVESALVDGAEILVEEYIDGDEVDIDILLQNGKIKFYCIADNYNKSKEEFFVDSGQALPSGLPEEDQEDLIEMAEETLEKLGIQNGCIHFEAKSTKQGPVPIEVNMRMGGDYVYSYIKGAFHVDLVEGAAKIAVGMYLKTDKKDKPEKYIVGWDLHPDFSGILVKLDIDEELYKKKYLEEVHLYKEIGDPVLLPPEGYESLGWLTVSGDNLLDAQDNLKEALSFIEFEVIKYDEESSVGKTARKNRFSAAVIKKDRLIQAAKIEKSQNILIQDQRKLHVGIALNAFDSYMNNFQPAAEQIEKELKKRGYKVTLFDFNTIAKTFIELEKQPVDIIFNLSQGINNVESLKPQAAALLEALRIPYTGSSSFNLALSRDKIRMKKLLAFHDIPTPKWDYAYTVEDRIDEELSYPLIVKPGNAYNSIGITNASVVTNKIQLKKQIKRIIEELRRPALVEEYIEGEEYSVSILGTDEEDIRVLPLTRSVFKKMPKNQWKIYTEKSKQMKSLAHQNVIIQNPLKNVSPKLEALITEIALDTYRIMRCRDYGRVEIRVDKDDNPHVIELNPNPFVDNYVHLLKSAELIGMNMGDLIEEIIRLSLSRFHRKKGSYYSHMIGK